MVGAHGWARGAQGTAGGGLQGTQATPVSGQQQSAMFSSIFFSGKFTLKFWEIGSEIFEVYFWFSLIGYSGNALTIGIGIEEWLVFQSQVQSHWKNHNLIKMHSS